MDVLKCANQEKNRDKNFIYCVSSQRWMSKRSKAILESTKCKICHNKNSLEGVINISHWWHCIVSIFSFLVQIFCKSNNVFASPLSLHCTLQGGGKIRNNFATWAGQERERERGMCAKYSRGPLWYVASVAAGRRDWVCEAYFQPLLLAGMLAM